MPTAPLYLRLFGDFELEGASTNLGQKAQALLAYLVLQEQPQPRSFLAALLWAELPPGRGLGNLRRELHALRAILDGQLEVTRHTIALRTGRRDWCDVLAFVDGLQQEQADVNSQQAALALYRAPLLAHFPGSQVGEEFAAWLQLWRDRLHGLALSAGQRLVEAAWQRDDMVGVDQLTQRWLALDPLSETAVYQRMLVLERQGEREAALEAFTTFEERLRQALGIAPSGRLQQLRDRLVARHREPAFDHATLTIGREQELADLQRLLQQQRLVTVLGPGGVGKTHLAHQLAGRWQAGSGQTAIFVELAGMIPGQPATATQTAVADRVGLAPAGTGSLLVQLVHYLRDKSWLLVLDNCEHLVEELGWIEALLQQVAGLRLLLTSRERLRLPGETLFNLHGLAVAASDEVPANESAAGQLFLLRARAASPGWQAAGQARYVNQICRALEGNPLGIALAATQLRTRTPADIAAHLLSALDWPAEQDSVPVRQQSLRATFEYSWQLLDVGSQRVLRHLSLFRGGFSLEAAVAVAAADYRSLLNLVDASLMRFDLQRRYDLHEPLRHYLVEKLPAGEKVLAQQQHGRYYAHQVAGWEHQLRGREQLAALHALRTDYANAQAAWLAAVEASDVFVLQQMTAGWCHYHIMRGLFQTGVAQFDKALNSFPQAPPTLQAQLRVARGALRSYLDDFDAALEDLQQGLSLLAEPHSAWPAFALNNLGDIARLRGDYAAATRQHQQALQTAQAASDLFEVACAYNGLGSAALRRSEFQEAETYYRRSYELHQQLGNHWHTARRVVNLGGVMHRQGYLEQAQQLLQEALELLEPFGDRDTMAVVFASLGNVADFAGRYPDAQHYYRQALKIRSEQGELYGMAVQESNLGVVCLRLGEYEQATQHIEQSLAYSHRLQDRRGISNQWTNLGLVAFYQRDFVTAERYFQQGLALRQEMGDHRGVGWSLFYLGEVALALGDAAAAMAWQEQSTAVHQELGDEWSCLFSYWGLSRALLARGELAAVEEMAQAVMQGAEQFNSDLLRTRAWWLLGSLCVAQGQEAEGRRLLQQVVRHPASEHFARESVAGLL